MQWKSEEILYLGHPATVIVESYGHHKQRISQQYNNGQTFKDKIWAGACEYLNMDGKLYQNMYLTGPQGVFGVHIINPDGSEDIRYIHQDHLGSWNTITDEYGNLIQHNGHE